VSDSRFYRTEARRKRDGSLLSSFRKPFTGRTGHGSSGNHSGTPRRPATTSKILSIRFDRRAYDPVLPTKGTKTPT
jgi:hypothetical protein